MDISRLEQVIIEDKYSKHNIHTHLRDDIAKTGAVILNKVIDASVIAIKNFLSQSYYSSKNERLKHITQNMYQDIVMEMLIIILTIKEAQPIQSVAAKLAIHLDYNNVFDGVKTASELLAVVCAVDMFDIIAARNSETGSLMIRSNFRLEEDTLQYLAKIKYLPPMIYKPDEITSNYSCGYITKDESVILGKDNHHSKNQALDALNIASGVELTLDTRMMAYEEISKNPLDTIEKVANHRRLVNSSTITCKELIDSGNVFYFTYKFDKRGRMYSQGYHVNIQSTSYKKSLINLANKQVITGVPS